MARQKIDILAYPEIKPSDNPDKLVVFLHGLGSDGNDLISLVPFFKYSLPNAHYISPHGVEAYDMAPFGRQWFSLADRTPSLLAELAKNNVSFLEKIITDKQKQLGLTNKDTIIIGFSQGTMMGVHLTLVQTDPYMAMIGFSGRFIPPEQISNKSTPICLIHGEEDEVVDPSELVKMAEAFTKLDIKFEKLMIPNLTHSIDASGIAFANQFILKYKLLVA